VTVCSAELSSLVLGLQVPRATQQLNYHPVDLRVRQEVQLLRHVAGICATASSLLVFQKIVAVLMLPVYTAGTKPSVVGFNKL